TPPSRRQFFQGRHLTRCQLHLNHSSACGDLKERALRREQEDAILGYARGGLIKRYFLDARRPASSANGIYPGPFPGALTVPSILQRSGRRIEGGWLVGGSRRSIASTAYRDQSQNPSTACAPSRACELLNGA